MDVTITPIEIGLMEAMHNMTLDTILTICELHNVTPAEMVTLAHRLAQREANADAFTGEFYVNSHSRDRH